MSEQRMGYTITASINAPIKIEYTQDKPDVREYLVNLRRDLLRKVRDLDELIAQLPYPPPGT